MLKCAGLTGASMARRPRGNPISWKVKYDETSETVSYTARVSMDITPDELEVLTEAGGRPTLLTPHVLRTSTAGVVACAGLMLR